jgi:hypothetical protein
MQDIETLLRWKEKRYIVNRRREERIRRDGEDTELIRDVGTLPS